VKGAIGMALLTAVFTGQFEISALDIGVACLAGGAVELALANGTDVPEARAAEALSQFSDLVQLLRALGY